MKPQRRFGKVMDHPRQNKEGGGQRQRAGQRYRRTGKTGKGQRIKELAVVIIVGPGRLWTDAVGDLGKLVAMGHAVREARNLRTQQADQGERHPTTAPGCLSAELIEKSHVQV